MSKTIDQLKAELAQSQAKIKQLEQLLGETPQDIKLTDISTPDDFDSIDYRFIVETSPDFILVVDTNNHIRYVNALAGDLTYEQIIGAPAIDFAPPEFRELASASFNKVMAGAEYSEYETVGPGPAGEIHWYRTRVSALKQAGQVIGAVLTATDITDRKQAEETLRYNEVLYRSIIDHLPDTVVAVLGQDLRYQLLGGADLKILEFNEVEVTGQTLPEVLGDEIGTPIEAAHKRALAGERFETEVPFADQIYQGTWVPLRNEAGEVIRSLAFNINITQRKQVELERDQAEEALRQNEELYRSIINNLPDSVVVMIDQDLRYRVVGGTDLEVLGLKEEDLVGRTMVEALGQEAGAPLEILYKRALAGERFETEVLFADQIYQGVWGPLLNDNGEITGALTSNINITKRKQAEETLRQNEELYFSIIDNLPDSVVSIVDQDFRYRMVGGRDVDMLGYIPAEMKNRTLREVFGDEAGLQFEAIFKQVLNGQRLDMEIPFEDQVYQAIWVPLLNDNDEVMSVLTSNINITKRKQAEEAVTQHAEELQNALTERDQVAREREILIGELETKNAELERFTYTVSHDLKSPLITIGGYLGYLEEDARNGNMERLEKDIAHINKATGQMQTLLDEVLELSRIGRVVNPSEAVHFKEIVDDVVALVQHQL